MVAGPDAEPDPERRWIASVGGGATSSPSAWARRSRRPSSSAVPPLIIEAVAGLALLGALGAALNAAMSDPGTREAAVATFVVTASGVTALGIGGAFWGLVAGLALLAVLRQRPSRPMSASG